MISRFAVNIIIQNPDDSAHLYSQDLNLWHEPKPIIQSTKKRVGAQLNGTPTLAHRLAVIHRSDNHTLNH